MHSHLQFSFHALHNWVYSYINLSIFSIRLISPPQVTPHALGLKYPLSYLFAHEAFSLFQFSSSRNNVRPIPLITHANTSHCIFTLYSLSRCIPDVGKLRLKLFVRRNHVITQSDAFMNLRAARELGVKWKQLLFLRLALVIFMHPGPVLNFPSLFSFPSSLSTRSSTHAFTTQSPLRPSRGNVIRQDSHKPIERVSWDALRQQVWTICALEESKLNSRIVSVFRFLNFTLKDKMLSIPNFSCTLACATIIDATRTSARRAIWLSLEAAGCLGFCG